MDAHLVGYGSSSEDEGKPRKHDLQEINKKDILRVWKDPTKTKCATPTPLMKQSGKERNFRKRSMSPEKDGLNEAPLKEATESHDLECSRNKLEQMERSKESKVDESPSEEKQSVSKSQSPPGGRSPGPDRKKNRDSGKKSRSRSRSSSSSSDKEQRSTVDEFGRRVRRHSGRLKDEDRSSKNIKRRYSREQRKSRSRSRSRSRDRDRGFRRRDNYHRKNDDRYKGRGGGPRRWSRGGSRSPDRNKERNRNRSRERSRSRDRSPKRRDRRGGGGQVYFGGVEKKVVAPGPAKEKEIMLSSEEIVKKLAARAESLKQEAQATATNLNLPSYLNPAVVNPQLYAKQQEKRKLLWSSKKTEEVPSNTNLWAGTRFTGDQGGEIQAKFRRLMGIKGTEGATVEPTEEDVSSKGEKILTNLEKEFERSRAFQLSRGAGGKSGIGLGYASANYNG